MRVITVDERRARLALSQRLAALAAPVGETRWTVRSPGAIHPRLLADDSGGRHADEP